MKPWIYEDRWALVTGASAGIGEVFARTLAERGMNLVLTARRKERLETLADDLRAFGRTVAVIPADLSRSGEAERLWIEASEVARIDLLVNNAGFGAQGRFEEVDLRTHLDLIEVNCTAVTILSHLAITEMRARRDGGLINVASIAAYQPVPTLATYAASKALVLSLTEALHAENSADGIRVLALNPGRTPTEFQKVAGTGSADGTFGYRTPAQVVDSALAAFEKGRSHSIPGWENAGATWVVRAIPRGPLTRAMRTVVRRFWKR